MALDISSPLPTVGGDLGTWGTKLNTAITEIINEAGKDSDIANLQSTKANKTNPVLDGTANGTAITTTGEADKLLKINSSGRIVLGGTDDGANKLQVTGSTKISGLAGVGTRMVVADPTGQLSAIYKNIYFFPFADITTGWTDIHTIDYACFLSITFYNSANQAMQGVILVAVTPTGMVTINNTDNTGLGVTVQYNAGKIQLKTTSGRVSGSVNRLG